MKHPVQKLADAVGGTITEVGELPDGSGFALMSMPLPKDHWSTQPTEHYEAPPMLWRVGTNDPARQRLNELVRAAARYAYRAATLQGTEPDLDPDALVKNFIVALLGYNTANGLSDDAWANPSPVPPLRRGEDLLKQDGPVMPPPHALDRELRIGEGDDGIE